jgi:hypothetical protein
MKPLVWISLLGMTSALAITSCNNDQNPAQYGNALVQPLKSAKKLDATVNVLEIKKSIQEFYAANGRYPADLNELSAFNGMTLKSDQFNYDPATGNLTEKL